ncbi:hypothetical protein NM208_g15226 [Fusarium decemcellulare]|uniref:Uncharacterized protein n=1 Tax=Fusarium decemcellulare TaxID=57161 RepID=A0ACC1RFG9_9HYPO|nr:hypothetical protein NM208_g15226 [Fusarium decemcellulare]
MNNTSDTESTLGALTSDDFDQIRAKTKVRLQEAKSARMKAALDLAELQGREQSCRAIQRASVMHGEAQREKINQRLGIDRRKDSDPMDQLLEATALSQMHLIQEHHNAIFPINRSLPALIAITKTKKEEASKAVRAAKGRLTALDHMWEGKLAAEKKHVAAMERERAALVMQQADNNYEKASKGLDNAISMAGQEDWAAIIRDVRAEKAKAS